MSLLETIIYPWMDGGMLSLLLEAGASVSVSSSYLPLMRGSLRKNRSTLPKNECANILWLKSSLTSC